MGIIGAGLKGLVAGLNQPFWLYAEPQPVSTEPHENEVSRSFQFWLTPGPIPNSEFPIPNFSQADATPTAWAAADGCEAGPEA